MAAPVLSLVIVGCGDLTAQETSLSQATLIVQYQLQHGCQPLKHLPVIRMCRHEDHPIFEADLSSKGDAGVRDVRRHACQLQTANLRGWPGNPAFNRCPIATRTVPDRGAYASSAGAGAVPAPVCDACGAGRSG